MNFREALSNGFEGRSEQERWRILQDVVASGAKLDDATVASLDRHMQGYLFVQDHVGNRRARIAFARSGDNMPYLRDAAGSRNVWMSDDEFGELVEQNDAATLACFARSEQMDPHQLVYIEYKLSLDPHGRPDLATADDAMITAKKAQELRGPARGTALMRLAKAALVGSADVQTRLSGHLRRSVMLPLNDPRALWRAYLNLKCLDAETLAELVNAAGRSSGRPDRASGSGVRSLH
jgi:hypothetical protein